MQVIAAKLGCLQIEFPLLFGLLLLSYDDFVLMFEGLHEVKPFFVRTLFVAVGDISLCVEIKVVIRHFCLNLN